VQETIFISLKYAVFPDCEKDSALQSVGRKYTGKTYTNLKNDEINSNRRMPKNKKHSPNLRTTDLVPISWNPGASKNHCTGRHIIPLHPSPWVLVHYCGKPEDQGRNQMEVKGGSEMKNYIFIHYILYIFKYKYFLIPLKNKIYYFAPFVKFPVPHQQRTRLNW
jgi:hypothetical protein